MHLQPASIGCEPRPDLAVFVVGSVVLDENGALPAIVDGQLLQQGQVSGGVEDRLLAVVEAGLKQFYGSQDLDALPLSVTGICGGWPTRLQVAYKVESWRKLASSLKIRAQSWVWAFV